MAIQTVAIGLPRLSSDRKVAPLVKKKGTAINDGTPKVKNTFGLPAIVSCPGHTEWCADACYALKLQNFPFVDKLVRANWELVSPHLDDVDTLHWMLSQMMTECRIQYERAKIPEDDWVFRHFWDGDIPSVAFARAIKRVAEDFPKFKFWLYTRSFLTLPFLIGPSNLAVYMSVDIDNVDEAVKYEKALRSLPPTGSRHFAFPMLAFCADTWEQTEQLAMKFPHRRKGPACPELTGKIPMVVWDDAGDMGRGACVECGMCIYGRNNVRFASTNRKGESR
jgi:hypothetical protein